MVFALTKLGRPTAALTSSDLGEVLEDYFAYRADVLNLQVEQDLMVTDEARELYRDVLQLADEPPQMLVDKAGKVIAHNVVVHGRDVRVPMNKQKDGMRAPSYFTGIVNILVAHSLAGRECDYDPGRIPVIDYDGTLYAALSRRMDGSYPSTVNPIAMWEIKEYYYTTTFGSKISDAVYITALDGYERLEVQAATGTSIEHLVMVDAYGTWWNMGKSYLCRFVDLLNMGLVSEVLFGREAQRRIPELVPNWFR